MCISGDGHFTQCRNILLKRLVREKDGLRFDVQWFDLEPNAELVRETEAVQKRCEAAKKRKTEK